MRVRRLERSGDASPSELPWVEKSTPWSANAVRCLQAMAAAVPAAAEAAAAVMVARVPSYAGLDPAQLLPGIAGDMQRVIEALDRSRGPSEAELQASAAVGAERAVQGISVEDMLEGFRVGALALMEVAAALTRRHRLTGAEVFRLLALAWNWHDAVMIAAIRAHRRVDMASARLDEGLRSQLLLSLLSGADTGVSALTLAHQLGLREGGAWRVLVAIASVAELRRLRDRLESPGGAPAGAQLAYVQGRLVALLPAAVAGLAGVTAHVGVAGPVPLGRIASAYREALRAAETAEAFAQFGVHSLETLGILPAVRDETALGRAFMTRYLLPVLQQSRAPARLLETVTRYLANGGAIERTAAECHVHPNSVRKRIERFEALTGARLGDQAVAVQVWWALQRYRLEPDGPGPSDTPGSSLPLTA